MTHPEIEAWAEEIVQEFFKVHTMKIHEGIIRDDFFERCDLEVKAAQAKYLNREGVCQAPHSLSIFDSVLNDLLGRTSHLSSPLW